jgi:2-polyprenyl-3-methyl-5-hydroxy-6-metoxy-1,4-benzoquinol methylase
LTDLNPQAKQMADESMVRNLDAQARAIWPQEMPLFQRYALPDEPRILDAGCGTGEGASRIAELFPRAQILAVDILDKNLEIARKGFANLAPRLTFEHQSIFELQAVDHFFDLTICRHVLHSIPHADQVMVNSFELHAAKDACISLPRIMECCIFNEQISTRTNFGKPQPAVLKSALARTCISDEISSVFSPK